jgi:hypothetical protein
MAYQLKACPKKGAEFGEAKGGPFAWPNKMMAKAHLLNPSI